MTVRRGRGRGMSRWLSWVAVLTAAFVTLSWGASVTYQYDELGRLKQVTYDDGTVTAYGLDAAGNRKNVTTTLGAGIIQLSAATYSVAENGTSVTITATRTGNASGAVSVSYATSNGTATAGSDYTAASGTLSWANGDTANKTFTVTILDDTIYEGNETVNLTLSAPTGGATLASPSTAVLTITENDNPPAGAVQLSASSYSVAENGTSVTITASRTGGSFGAVGVSYATSNGTATAGSDYTAASGTLSWSNGDTANKTFTVTILNDTDAESSESFTATISSPTGGATLGTPSSATVTITDDDSTVPSVPTGITNTPTGHAANYSVSWTASTGSPTYYVLQEDSDMTFPAPTNYTINVPTVSKGFSNKLSGDYYYRVKACNASNQCSAYSTTTHRLVCNGPCL